MVEGIGVVQQVLRWFTIDSEPLQHRIQAKLIKIVFYKISLMEIQTKAVRKAMDDIRKLTIFENSSLWTVISYQWV